MPVRLYSGRTLSVMWAVGSALAASLGYISVEHSATSMFLTYARKVVVFVVVWVSVEY